MKKYLLYIFILTKFIVFAQSKTDWEREKLHGKVLSVREISYTIVQEGASLEKKEVETLLPNTFIQFNSEGDYLLKKKYDKNNRLLEESVYTYERNPRMEKIRNINAQGEVFLTIISSIDDRGNAKDIRFYDEKNNITRNIVYKYDRKYRQIERRVVDKGVLNERLTYKYNSKNDIVEQYSYFANQTVAQKWIFVYDDNHNRIQMSLFNHKGVLEKITRYQYNDKNNKISQKIFDIDENLLQEDTFLYDTFSNEISAQRKIMSNDIYWHKKQEYTYDSYGNWTKKIIFINGNPVTISEREIVYFP